MDFTRTTDRATSIHDTSKFQRKVERKQINNVKNTPGNQLSIALNVDCIIMLVFNTFYTNLVINHSWIRR